MFPDPDFRISHYHQKRGEIHECLENIYASRTKKWYPDPDLHKFHYPRKNGVEFTSFLWMSIYSVLRNCILTLIFIFFLSEEIHKRNRVEFVSFLWMSMYSALRNSILTPIFILFYYRETGWNSSVSSKCPYTPH